MSNTKLNIAVLISGTGSNLKAIIDSIQQNKLNANIVCVISNRAQAAGLQHAINANIPTHVISSKDYPDREQYDQALAQQLGDYQPQLVVLAGFMRILSEPFVRNYYGRLLNIHPSLLPKYRGLDTHARALAAGDIEHGVSIHYVSETLDGGPVVCQAKIKVGATDTEDSLAERIHRIEHQIYPEIIEWIATDRLRLDKNIVYLDNNKLPATGYIFTDKQLANSHS